MQKIKNVGIFILLLLGSSCSNQDKGTSYSNQNILLKNIPTLESICLLNIDDGEISYEKISELNNKGLISFLNDLVHEKKYTIKPRFLIVPLAKNSVEVYFYPGFPVDKDNMKLEKDIIDYIEKSL